MLPLRQQRTKNIVTAGFPEQLVITSEIGDYGLPVLRGELNTAAVSALLVVLHVRNSAGIPIIQGQAQVEPGSRNLHFAKLSPIGIDAYAHKSQAEQIQIAERIWSRRSSGSLHFQSES